MVRFNVPVRLREKQNVIKTTADDLGVLWTPLSEFVFVNYLPMSYELIGKKENYIILVFKLVRVTSPESYSKDPINDTVVHTRLQLGSSD